MRSATTSAVLLSSNIFFLAETDYFDPEALSKPLLHTWSLGVEEQFYLISPAIPFLFAKLPQAARRWVYAGLFGLLFGFCVGLQAKMPSAAFYVMPARLWEFLAGAAVAAGIVPALRSNLLAEGLAGLGLTGLMLGNDALRRAVAASWLADAAPRPCDRFAVPYRQVPLHFGRKAARQRIPVFLGLISYSLYLWHWPMLVFARYQNIRMTSGVWLVGGVVLVGLSYLSWKFVEEPFRAPQAWVYRRARLILASGAVLLLATCTAVIALRGLPGRFDPAVAQVASYYGYGDRREFREGECFITSKYGDAAYFNRTTCLHESSVKKNILLLGDSHAAHLWIGMKTVFSTANVMQATASGCKPLLGTPGETYCTDLMEEVMRRFLPSHPVDAILLSAAWNVSDHPITKRNPPSNPLNTKML